jgi:hypothetical protein
MKRKLDDTISVALAVEVTLVFAGQTVASWPAPLRLNEFDALEWTFVALVTVFILDVPIAGVTAILISNCCFHRQGARAAYTEIAPMLQLRIEPAYEPNASKMERRTSLMETKPSPESDYLAGLQRRAGAAIKRLCLKQSARRPSWDLTRTL